MIFNIFYRALLSLLFISFYAFTMEEKKEKDIQKIYDTHFELSIKNFSVDHAFNYFDAVYDQVIANVENLLNSNFNGSPDKLKNAIENMQALRCSSNNKLCKSDFCNIESQLLEKLLNTIWCVNDVCKLQDFLSTYNISLPIIAGQAALIDYQMRLHKKIAHNNEYKNTICSWINSNFDTTSTYNDRSIKGMSSHLITNGNIILKLSKKIPQLCTRQKNELNTIMQELKNNQKSSNFASRIVIQNIPKLFSLILPLTFEILKEKQDLKCSTSRALIRGVANVAMYQLNIYHIAQSVHQKIGKKNKSNRIK